MGGLGTGALVRAVGLALGASLLLAPPAVAGDANRVPPAVWLSAAGAEGIVGPRTEALAYFSTADLSAPKPGAEYPPGSKVTFACTIDGRPARCPAEYIPTIDGRDVELLRAVARGPYGERLLPSSFDGYVPAPEGLSAGAHTVSVVASDEDGTSAPATTTVLFDPVPPTAPELIDPPPRRSRLHKPTFRFASSDETRLVRPERIFTATLFRLAPDWKRWREGSTMFSSSSPRCPTLLSCTAWGRALYWGQGNGVSLGIPERLTAGRYEFRVRARDAAGNKSPFTTYRFQILPGGPQG